MNYVIFEILVFCAHVSFQNEFIYQGVKEGTQVKMRIQISKLKCRERYPLGQKLIDEAQEGHLSDSMELRKYYFCYGREIKFLKNPNEKVENGILDVVKLKDWLKRLEHDTEAVDKAVEECKIDGEESEEKIFQFIICLAGRDVPVDVVGKNYIEKVREEINENHESCQQSSHLDQSVINEAQKGQFPNDQALQEHYDCFAIHVRYMDAVYDFHLDVLRDWLINFLRYEATAVDKALDKCYKPDKYHYLQLNFNVIKCLSEDGVHVDVIAS